MDRALVSHNEQEVDEDQTNTDLYIGNIDVCYMVWNLAKFATLNQTLFYI